MSRSYIRKNLTTMSIFLFLIIFIIIQMIRPAFIYDQHGGFRQFGIGYKSKTVIPIWLVTIMIAILSYLFVLYYITLPKYSF